DTPLFDRFSEIRFAVDVGPGVRAFRIGAASPEHAVSALATSQQLAAEPAAERACGHSIIVGDPCLATLVEACAVPIGPPAVLRPHHTAGANRAAETLVRFRGRLAILVMKAGPTLGETAAAPERTLLAYNTTQRPVAVRTEVPSHGG